MIWGQEIIFYSAADAASFAARNSRVYILQRQNALLNMSIARFSIQDFLPALDFSISESDSTTLLAGDSRTKTIQASISQTIFNAGKSTLTYNMNRSNALYGYRDYELSLQNFRSEVISIYYQYLLQKELIEIKEELVTAAKAQLIILEKEVELGITLETDYLEYLISYVQIEFDRDQSIRDLHNLERRFKNVLGLGEQVLFEIRDLLFANTDHFLIEPHNSRLLAIVLRNSLDLKKQDISIYFSSLQITDPAIII
jgi:outer membrane protein TolC